MTITEALAEIKIIQKRIATKQDLVGKHVMRHAVLRDPFDSDGGTRTVILRERQAIRDLQTRLVAIRTAIQRANSEATITINDTTMTVAEWLNWRRDCAPINEAWLKRVRQSVDADKRKITTQGAVITADSGATGVNDVIQLWSDLEIASDIEQLDDVLGKLDGRLSLVNATMQINVN